MDKSDILLVLMLSHLGGISCASFLFTFPLTHWELFLLLFITILVGPLWKYKKIVLVTFSFGAFFFGYFSYVDKALYAENIVVDGGVEEVRGRVSREYVYSNSKRIVLELIGKWEGVKAITYIDRYEPVLVGDVINVSGSIARPENFSNFDYVGYLAKDDIFISIENPTITSIVGRGEDKYFDSLLHDAKDYISRKIAGDFVPSQAAVVQAMVLGESEKMSKEYKEKLSKTGLSHAIAISGSHFVLISVFLSWLFLFLGFWKRQALVMVTISISIYIALISFPASAVRAGVMISLFYLAKITGRQSQSWRLLIFAAFIMCLENPMLLKHDLGFQLSFLAVAGLIYLAPPISNILSKIFRNHLSWMEEIISATLAAQLAVFPFLASTMGGISFSGIIANIFVVPVMPFCLGIGFAYSLLCFLPFLSNFLSFLAFPSLWYLNTVIDIFSRIPFAYVEVNPHPLLIFLSYALLVILAVKGRKKQYFDF
jgi:competence protein ComEC